MPDFVEQHKERVADDEFHPIDSLLFGEVLQARIVLECARNLFDPGLKRRRAGGRRLCRDGAGAEQQDAEQSMNERTLICGSAGRAGASLSCHGKPS
jgi:hypothetical protein